MFPLFWVVDFLKFWIFYLYFDHFLSGRGAPDKKAWLCAAAFSLALTAANLVCVPIINTAAEAVLIFLFAGALWTSAPKQRILLSVAIFALSVLTEGSSALITSLIFRVSLSETVGLTRMMLPMAVASELMLALIIIALRVMFPKGIREREPQSEISLIFIAIFNLTSIYLLIALLHDHKLMQHDAGLVAALSITLLATCVVVFVEYDKEIKKRELEYRLKLARLESRARQVHLNQTAEDERRLHSFVHDLKNQLIGIREAERNADVSQLLQEVIDGLASAEPGRSRIVSDNNLADMIFEKNRVRCASEGIGFEAVIECGDLSRLDFFDTSVILDNLFDNAFYACKLMPREQDRYIRVRVLRKGDNLILIMQNTKCNRIISGKSGELFSTKRSGYQRGLGFENVMRAVKKYDGIVRRSDNAGSFEVNVILDVNRL